jgi:hypothetical protein
MNFNSADKKSVLDAMANLKLRNNTSPSSNLCGPIRSLDIVADTEIANRFLHSNIATGQRTALVFDRQDGSWSLPIVWDVQIHDSEIRFFLARNCILHPRSDFQVFVEATGELLKTCKVVAVIEKQVKHGGGNYPEVCSFSSDKLRVHLTHNPTDHVNITVHVRNFKANISILASSIPRVRTKHKLVTGTILGADTVPNRLIAFLTHHMSVGFTHFYLYATFNLITMPIQMQECLNQFAESNPDTVTITQWFPYFLPATYNKYGLEISQLAIINTLIYRLRSNTFSTWIAHIDTDEFLTPNRNLTAYVTANEGKTHSIIFQQSYMYLNPGGTNRSSRSDIVHGDGDFTYADLNGSVIVSEGCSSNYHRVTRSKSLFNANGVKFAAVHFPEKGGLAHDTRYGNGLQCFLHFAPRNSYRSDSNERFEFIERVNRTSSLSSLLSADRIVEMETSSKRGPQNLKNKGGQTHGNR